MTIAPQSYSRTVTPLYIRGDMLTVTGEPKETKPQVYKNIHFLGSPQAKNRKQVSKRPCQSPCPPKTVSQPPIDPLTP